MSSEIPKLTVRERLNKFVEPIELFQTAHKFWYHVIWFFFIALPSIWGFMQFIREEGFVRLLISSVVIIIFAVSFAIDCHLARRQHWNLFWKPWLLVLLLLANTVYWGSKLRDQEDSKVIMKSSDEAKYDADFSDPKFPLAFQTDAKKAFESGNYPYCKKFYEQDFASGNDGEKLMGMPEYAASCLALNLTPDGLKQFHAQLDNLVMEIASDIKNTNYTGYYNKPDYLQTCIHMLAMIKDRLPDNEKKYVGDIKEQVSSLKIEAAKKRNHAP